MKTPYVFSDHAVKRRQQRGIRQDAVKVLLDYGSMVDHGGNKKYHMDKAARRRAMIAMGADAYRRIADRLNIYVVVASDGTIVTQANRWKKLIASKPHKTRKHPAKRRRPGY